MRFRILLLALLPVLLGAKCELVTRAHLADPLKAEPDASLYGHWVRTEKEQGKTRDFHVFIGKHSVKGNPGSIMEACTITWEKDELKVVSDGSKIYFMATPIGGSTYFCVMDVEGERD